MSHWQMTFQELEADSFKPSRKLLHIGTYVFFCPVCGEAVGFYRNPRIDPITNGMYYKREQCKNGHAVDWSDVKEAEK